MKAIRESPLPRFSVDRPITVVMVLTALLVVGYISYTRISMSFQPEGLEGKWLGVWISYENATPADVEKKITRRIEEALAAVRRIEQIRTYSNNDGVWTSIRFLPETDMDQAYGELWERLHRVAPELPRESRKFWVRRWDSTDAPLVWTSVAFTEAVSHPFELLDTFLKPYLLRIDGVAQVEIWGIGEPEVHVELDRAKMRRYGIDPSELVNRMRNSTLTMPSGYVLDGGKKLFVRSVEELRSMEEMRATVVDWAHNVRLGDVATVKPEQKFWRSTRWSKAAICSERSSMRTSTMWQYSCDSSGIDN